MLSDSAAPWQMKVAHFHWMILGLANRQLRRTQCFRAAMPVGQSRIKLVHKRLSALVGYRPKAHQQRFGIGDLEGASKPEDTLARVRYRRGRCRMQTNDQPCDGEVEGCDVLSGKSRFRGSLI